MSSYCESSDPCPLAAFLRLLSGPWTLYILYVLRTNGPTRFGALKRKVEGISTRVLTERLRMLETAGLVYREYEPTVPPQVTYGLTERMKDLGDVLEQLDAIALRWHEQQQNQSATPTANKSVTLTV